MSSSFPRNWCACVYVGVSIAFLAFGERVGIASDPLEDASISFAFSGLADCDGRGAALYTDSGIIIYKRSFEPSKVIGIGDTEEGNRFVKRVYEGSQAKDAGVMPGSRITHINGNAYTTSSVVEAKHSNSKFELTFALASPCAIMPKATEIAGLLDEAMSELMAKYNATESLERFRPCLRDSRAAVRAAAVGSFEATGSSKIAHVASSISHQAPGLPHA